MPSVSKKSFVKAIKSKVIIAVALACLALFMAWMVSRVAFREMLTTVENIAEPSERLRIVNVISRKIGTLDQLQKGQAYLNSDRYRKGFKESLQLRAILDTLGLLYPNDSVQLARIHVIKKLLNERDKQFVNYLKVRERLINNKPFSDQVKNINEIVSKRTADLDSTVVATEEKTSTTTIYPTEEKSQSFFSKLFGRKRSEADKSIKIVSEEKTKRDTIALSAQDKMTKSLEKSLSIIEADQRKNHNIFLSREAALAAANNALVSRMLDVLRQVENEVVKQIELNGTQAKKVVNTGINTISLIMLVFVSLTGVMLYLILTDITRSGLYRNELERAKDEAEYHGKAKQRFLSNMSHEIRTPLQSIIGYADIMKRDPMPSPDHIDAIQRSSEHLLQIVNEILDYNRITSGKFTFSNEPFDMGLLLDDVLSVMRPQAELKSLTMVKDFENDRFVKVNGDAFRLKQILYNLLANAIKFTSSGKVTLSASYKIKNDDLHFTFAIKDTGIGISELDCARIFNEFEQGEQQQDSGLNQQGAGLGLNIVKALVENQGGRIYVKSKLGEGSVFTVYITFSKAVDLGSDDLPLKNSMVLPQKVWIVDDDHLILELCELIFKRNNVSYKTFDSPQKLLNEAWDESVECVLMDIRMPGMDGISLCQALKARLVHPVTILAITAQVLPDERAHLLKHGFDGLVMKPFRETEILSAITISQETDASFEDLEMDLGPLKEMTYGDEQLLKNILARFDLDCRNDIKAIQDALERPDFELICLIIHRLAGRIAQIGSKSLSGDFRRCEIELTSQTNLNEYTRHTIHLLLKRLEKLCYSIS